MKCKKCGYEFEPYTKICPYCGFDNNYSLSEVYGYDYKEYGMSFEDYIEDNKSNNSSILDTPKSKNNRYDPYDFDNPDNCSDREYMDDEDYDDNE